YFNKPSKDYFFNKIVFIYNAKENTWENAGELPGAGTAGSSSAMENNSLTLINGELKPGLRTDVIYRAIWDNDKLTWLKNSQLPPSPGEQHQEGLAGAFSGYSQGVLLVGGGANFPGAKQNYTDGKFYAHEGINKKWRDEVYGLINGHWQYVGKMKQPLGYGVSVSYGDEIFLIGGENAKGKPVSSVISFAMHDGKLLIE
ncbi:YjhT family mutarotase, partial [Salmonella enterica]|nr:YjhT family mutarotase [Salmonella enterica]ECI0362649.1 YjhT family mutarotase [Salmonella enterica subsp. arizonae]